MYISTCHSPPPPALLPCQVHMISHHHSECEEKLAAMAAAEADYKVYNEAATAAAAGVDAALAKCVPRWEGMPCRWTEKR